MDIIVFILNIARYNNNDYDKGERKITIGPRNLITKEKIETFKEILTFYDLITKEKTENVQEWAWILQTYLLEMK